MQSRQRHRPAAPGAAGRWRSSCGLVVLAATASIAAAQPPDAPPPERPAGVEAAEAIEVVAPTPIAGIGVDRDKVPANVQRLSAESMERTGASSLVEQLQVLAPSVHLSDATTNPFQPDLQFRGFVGSPLLGLPQGLTVYQNGVRLNEPFGDTVNWDLIPSQAVAGIDLMPGSNPLFGLNALGGALAIETKTGQSHPGHMLGLSTGSFGRHLLRAASGGSRRAWNWFVAVTAGVDDGWRDESPSRVRQAFADLGWRGGATVINATASVGHNRLVGNGAAPVQLLAEDRSAVYTHPDVTATRAFLATVRGQHRVGASASFEAVLAYRRAGIDTFNGDDTNYEACDGAALLGFLCADAGAGDLIRLPSGESAALAAGQTWDGTNNTSATNTHGWSAAGQATVVAPLAGHANHFVAGLSIDGGRARYAADTEIAQLTDDRGTVGTGLIDAAAAVRLRTTVRHAGAYLADFFSVTPRLTLSASARLNQSAIALRDLAGTALDGDHRFIAFNPGAGLTFALPVSVTLYGGVGRASRVPAPSELSCADPDDPCRLPNAFVADPPLNQVVATTWEGGLRGLAHGLRWNASMFRTASRDDILFISSGPLRNTGHFANVGRTVRQGAELSATGGVPALRWGASYTWLRARFGAPLTLSSPHHPLGRDGEIDVQPGDRLPGVPQHNLKVHASAAVGRATFAGQVTHTSSLFLRGDEANLLPALDGSTLTHVAAGYTVTSRVRVTVRVINLLGARYANFGLLGEADDLLGDRYDDPRFVSPGAPRAASVGLDLAF